jgi:hypothetical protein
MSTRIAGAVLVVAVTLLTGGCGDSERDSETVQGTAPTSPSAAPATSATTTATDGIDPLAGAGTNPVVGEPEGASTALLTRVGIGRHEGYDRVVFEFREGLPGYRVEYVEPPLHEDGSGNVIQVDGTAFVVVRMEPASGFDLSVPEGELVYTGPRRLSGADGGTSVVREVVRTGDFEAVLTWAVGLSDRVDFRVTRLESPARLVVDFRNH